MGAWWHTRGVPTASSWISPKARKGTLSSIEGRGLFAVEDIAAGEVVAVKGGHIVDTATMFAQSERLGQVGADVIVVEPPEGSSVRRTGPFVGDEPGPERSLDDDHQVLVASAVGGRNVVGMCGDRIGREDSQ